VFEGDARGLAEELLQQLGDSLSEADLSLSEMTPAMGVHTGPGVVGYALCVDRPDA
jgi:fatty acid-binding protein DegV